MEIKLDNECFYLNPHGDAYAHKDTITYSPSLDLKSCIMPHHLSNVLKGTWLVECMK